MQELIVDCQTGEQTIRELKDHEVEAALAASAVAIEEATKEADTITEAQAIVSKAAANDPVIAALLTVLGVKVG